MGSVYIHMCPSDLVCHLFGGVRATARAIGREPSSVSKWKKAEEEGGCGGRIPSKARRLIMDYAKKNGIKLSSSDLDFGRKVKVVAK